MTRVKICGVSDLKTAEVATEAGADFVGMVFAPSPRQVTLERAKKISEEIHKWRGSGERIRLQPPPKNISGSKEKLTFWKNLIDENIEQFRPLLVGVFADQPVEFVNSIAQAVGLDLVQLSGYEKGNYCTKLEIPALEVVHVFPKTTAQDIVQHISSNKASGLLLDTATRELKGGTGKVFDWKVAMEVNMRVPFMLAGGLTEKNVAQAITIVTPWAVDVSSGVEKDGKKDHQKIKEFIRTAKGALSGT